MNSFDVKAAAQERAFIRKAKSGTTMLTGTGRVNTVVSVDGNVVYLRTAKSKRPFAIRREHLRGAIRYMLERRMATRRDLEHHSKYSSALLALLKLIFAGKARVKRTLRGLLRLTLSDVRHVFSGVARAPHDMTMVREHGGVEVLVSYAHAREDRHGKWAEHVRQLGLRVMVDSGAYTVFSAEQRGIALEPVTVEGYVEWLKRYKDVIHSVINLDVINDHDSSSLNLAYLRRHGIPAIPVWHCKSSWDVLDAIVRTDEPVIAIGGSVFLSTKQRREIFDELFHRHNGQAFHLLGGTSPVISEYPWFSADSTSYLMGRKYRKVVTPTVQLPAPESWTGEECLAFSISKLSAMEGNYSRQHELPLLVKPNIVHPEQELKQVLLFR